MNELIRLDSRAFEFINSDLSNSFFDSVMPTITDLHKSWVFVAAILISIGFWVWKDRKRAPRLILGLALSVACSELVSYRIIKHYVSRPRPSFTQDVKVNLRTHEHSGESFPSLHTSNNFAGATYLSFYFLRLSPIFFAFATLIGFSRIYVGVHFPGDVVAGAVVGSLCGIFCWWISRRYLKVS